MTDLTNLTIQEAHTRLKEGDLTSVELTQAHLDRIEQVDNRVRAFLTVTAEQALEQAAQADQRRANGEDDPLLGMPLAYKDVLATQGVQTTCGSKILEGYRPPFSATAVEKLEARGAVMLGKTNMDEFAMGSSTENSGYHTTHNPWDLDRVPGGSSGGSAAAVAAQMCPGALGTDTGGSVRQPASLCGVVGLKPSYGRVSRYGLIAYGSSLDQVGAFARTVADVTVLLEAIAGHDLRDSTSLDSPVPAYQNDLSTDLKGLKVGVPREYFIGEGMPDAVEQKVKEAIAQLEALGAQAVEISLPHTKYALPVYYLIATAECSANLARFDGVRYGPRSQTGDMWEDYRQTRGDKFGAEVKRRIMLGTYALSAGYYDAYYLKAQKVRTLIKQDFDQAFGEVDVIACPVSPTTAFRIGERMDDPLQMYLSDVFSLAINLSGICGVSVPCGFDGDGLPVGLQLLGPAFGESQILKAAHAYEQSTEWHIRQPEL